VILPEAGDVKPHSARWLGRVIEGVGEINQGPSWADPPLGGVSTRGHFWKVFDYIGLAISVNQVERFVPWGWSDQNTPVR
jgi:hypothetical protein